MARRTRVPKDAPVKLVAVTKNHDVEAMREAIDAGATDIGENRIQEAKSKFDILDRDVTWHLIGHLQTNKVNKVVGRAALIESVDSEHLLTAIEKKFNIKFKLADVRNLKNVGDLLDLVARMVG